MLATFIAAIAVSISLLTLKDNRELRRQLQPPVRQDVIKTTVARAMPEPLGRLPTKPQPLHLPVERFQLSRMEDSPYGQVN